MLLDRGGIAVVGSRDADREDIEFTERLGDTAARQGHSIVSGGARGVDQSAMLGALDSEGTAVGVMADSLLRAATSARFRKHILAGDLVLISPFNPESGFHVGKAMSRNRYIYCLADAAVVVSSTPGKGGTWNGAIEALGNTWVPVWVKRKAGGIGSGNHELVRHGAHWMPDDPVSLECLFDGSCGKPGENGRAEPARPATGPDLPSHTGERLPGVCGEPAKDIEPVAREPERPNADGATSEPARVPANGDFYTFFLSRMREFTDRGPKKVEEIALRFQLQKSQVHIWLKRGQEDGEISKLQRPARYQATACMRQQALFT